MTHDTTSLEGVVVAAEKRAGEIDQPQNIAVVFARGIPLTPDGVIVGVRGGDDKQGEAL